MTSVQEYLNLVTSEYQNQPNFMAMVQFFVSLPVQVQSLYEQMMTTLFDLDNPPAGNQLDIIGQWVGISRNVNIPNSGNLYFTWDDVSADGWDFGSWVPVPPQTTVVSLADPQYLTLLRAKIAANQWSGTTEGAYAIWENVFPTVAILIQDLNNMSYNMILIGGIIDSITLALITGGYIPLRPEGVEINEYLVSVDTNKGFAWDTENAYLAGWDQSSWLKIVQPT